MVCNLKDDSLLSHNARQHPERKTKALVQVRQDRVAGRFEIVEGRVHYGTCLVTPVVGIFILG